MTWALGYIEDAATARLSVHRRDGSLFTDKSSNYAPPKNGVHLCGVTDDEEQPTTVAIYPMQPDQAEEMWRLAKQFAECLREEADFIVDLFIGGDVQKDFWSNRQLWPRAIDAWNDPALAIPHPLVGSGDEQGQGRPASAPVKEAAMEAPTRDEIRSFIVQQLGGVAGPDSKGADRIDISGLAPERRGHLLSALRRRYRLAGSGPDAEAAATVGELADIFYSLTRPREGDAGAGIGFTR